MWNASFQQTGMLFCCTVCVSVSVHRVLQHQFERGKYSLNDEEELTHYGQSLSEIEKFEDPVITDDEDDEDDVRRNGECYFEFSCLLYSTASVV